MPYSYFVELAAELKDTEDFRTWKQGSANCHAVPATPIPLLLLAVLRYLGRAWTLDDLSKSTCTSQESVQRFLHKFLAFGSTTLYQRYVLSPSCTDEAGQHMGEYSDGDFHVRLGLLTPPVSFLNAFQTSVDNRISVSSQPTRQGPTTSQ